MVRMFKFRPERNQRIDPKVAFAGIKGTMPKANVHARNRSFAGEMQHLLRGGDKRQISFTLATSTGRATVCD